MDYQLIAYAVVIFLSLIKVKADKYKARAAELDKAFKDLSVRFNALNEQIMELRRVLRMYPEWMYSKGSHTVQFCVCCGNRKEDGHKPDCQRQKVLGEA